MQIFFHGCKVRIVNLYVFWKSSKRGYCDFVKMEVEELPFKKQTSSLDFRENGRVWTIAESLEEAWPQCR